MKVSAKLKQYLSNAPEAPCTYYDAGDTVMCIAKGKAKNTFPIKCRVAAVALETDDNTYRFPPEKQKGVCDWCIFSENGLRGIFVELKGSNFKRAVEQLESTMSYMQNQYNVVPQRAIAVLSGSHPSNAYPGKANIIKKFKKAFPQAVLCERSIGQAKQDDELR